MQLDWFRVGISKLIQNKFDSAAFIEGPDAGNDAGVLAVTRSVFDICVEPARNDVTFVSSASRN
jgi:hypothetical protein